jgi:hypothetical protein
MVTKRCSIANSSLGWVMINAMSKPLIETNKYLKDPKRRRRVIVEGAWDSSVAEGAKGITKAQGYNSLRKARSKASSKKSDKAS